METKLVSRLLLRYTGWASLRFKHIFIFILKTIKLIKPFAHYSTECVLRISGLNITWCRSSLPTMPYGAVEVKYLLCLGFSVWAWWLSRLYLCCLLLYLSWISTDRFLKLGKDYSHPLPWNFSFFTPLHWNYELELYTHVGLPSKLSSTWFFRVRLLQVPRHPEEIRYPTKLTGYRHGALLCVYYPS